MPLPLALLCGIGVAALLIAATAYLQRYLLVRQLAFVLFVGAIAAGLKVFTLLAGATNPLFESTLSWILVFLTAIAVLRVAGLLVFEVHLPHRGLRLPPLLPLVAVGLAYGLAALVTLKLAFPGINLGPVLATSAITSLVLGLALQPILGNFFAGVVISLEKPFRINDWIKVGDIEGRVVNITWRTTHLRTRDNDTLILPNGKVASEEVLNYFYPHPLHLEHIRVGAHYSAPPYRVRQALLDCATGVAGALEKPTPEVYMLGFDESAISYELRVWIEDIAQKPRIRSEIQSRIWEEFKRRGLVIPYPIRTLELAPRRRRPAALPAAAPAKAHLFVVAGEERGQTLALDGEPVTVGRSRACTLPLADSQASKEHLRLEWKDGGWELCDLETSYGTQVNGHKAARHRLQDLDRITIGDTVMVFERDVD